MDHFAENVNVILGALSALLLAATALVPVLVAAWMKLKHRDDTTDQRVDLLWQAYLRRGQVEGTGRNMIQKQPQDAEREFALRPDVRRAYEPLASILREMRSKEETDGKFAEAVEKRFGEWLMIHICGPLNLNQGACLKMALIVATEATGGKS